MRTAVASAAIAAGMCVWLEARGAQPADVGTAMNDIAEQYVRLVLAVGQHDADYVDAYYGPSSWREAAAATRRSIDELDSEARRLADRVPAAPATAEPLVRLRHDYLRRQIQAVGTRLQLLRGARLPFDEESQALYDAVAPEHPAAYYAEAARDLEPLLPGGGTLVERYERFRREFVIPPDRLATVFDAAIQECRRRSVARVPLPAGESFRVEYVTDKPWSGYNWYQGNFHSLIQVNTDLPIYVDRAVDLACHEGYPGHHVYNLLLEERLVRQRGWLEFTVYPLFSPQSLIAEGTANYGIDVTFPGDERLAFERDVVFPLAGLDPGMVALYYRVQALVERLAYAGNEAARGYLDGRLTRSEAVSWLTTYALMSEARAEQRTRFFDRYRSYVINYNRGKDLVRDYVEAEAQGSASRRWTIFAALLSSPRLPAGLQPAR
jgi:hypothetical protein